MEEYSMPSIRGSMANKADTLDERGKAEGGGVQEGCIQPLGNP